MDAENIQTCAGEQHVYLPEAALHLYLYSRLVLTIT